MDARTEMLHRVRTAIGDRQPVSVPREYRWAGAEPVDLELFAERVRDYRAVVRFAAPDEVAAAITEICASHSCHRVVASGAVPDGWVGALEVRRDDPPMSVAELDALDGTLTTCSVGIAETGTIVLEHGPDQGRRALTLVPDLHVVVVRADQVVARVPDALPRLRATEPQTWISGPSATSDIELSRVEGVHGPRRLEVVIIRP